MLKLAIFDDEPIIVQGMGILVERSGLPLTVACTALNGLTALEQLSLHRPEIVLSDIRMPGVDGLTLIEQAAAILPDSAFLIMSGYRDFDFVKRALALRVVDYLEKPVTLETLTPALRRAMSQLGAQQSRASVHAIPEGPPAEAPANRADIRRLISYIHQHYSEDISLGDLADLAEMNPAYLSNLFKETVGMSYVKYLTGVRLEQAKVFLARGERTSAVAKTVGYADDKYFRQVFKKNEGLTPSEYRQKAQGKDGRS
jgi:YesN/AraC family two-component response regulator